MVSSPPGRCVALSLRAENARTLNPPAIVAGPDVKGGTEPVRRQWLANFSESSVDVYVPGDDPSLQTQLETMRRVIGEVGEIILSYAELRSLYPDSEFISNQWEAVARIAINEKWSFTFFPNGDVRFADLDPP